MSAFEFIGTEKASQSSWSVSAMCAALGVSCSGYHAHAKRSPSERARRREKLTAEVITIYEESGARYGSARITKALRRKGERVTKKTVATVMALNSLRARPKKKYKATTDSRNTTRIAPNILERDFTTSRPNQVWVTDVTAYWTLGGWVYLAAIIDLFSRRIVGWAISEHNDTQLALLALRRAHFARKPPRGVVHHSDRGSPYASDDYIAALALMGMERSMSRKGDCWDNACAESFFSTLEFECVRGATFGSLLRAERVLGDYIEGFYNPVRLHSTNDYVSPIEAEVSFFIASKSA